jgi:hypothetical protein
MYLKVFLTTTLIYLTSCSESKTPFCSCIDSGNQLNIAMKDIYTKDVSASEKANIEKLKKEQEKLCADYKYMDGAQMLELQKECENK